LILSLVLLVLVLTTVLLGPLIKRAAYADEDGVHRSEHRQKGEDRQNRRHHEWLVRHLVLLLGDFLKSVTRKEGPA
jgi:hypothetical protein